MLPLQLLWAQDQYTTLQYSRPQNIVDFRPIFHFSPVNQDTTNACWSFSTISYIETELQRLNDQSVKLAVMFPVYHAFLEKARYFVATRGESRFMPGDLFSTVFEIVQTYGIVPEDVYHGQVDSSRSYNHKQMENEIAALKVRIQENSFWDEQSVVTEVKAILDTYLGAPPDSFVYRGEEYTPLTFAAKYVNLPWNDYIMVMTFSSSPFDTYAALDVPDNWRNINRYFNVTLDVFYSGMKSALQSGFSCAIDGDYTEPGRMGELDVAFIPEYDIPGSYISQAARQYRFDNGVTKDDHLMHMIGFSQVDGEDWFLVKDSWRDAFEGEHKGYFFYHADFARLKILAYLVHKDGVPDIVERMGR
jgi:bleomycin hydrolase